MREEFWQCAVGFGLASSGTARLGAARRGRARCGRLGIAWRFTREARPRDADPRQGRQGWASCCSALYDIAAQRIGKASRCRHGTADLCRAWRSQARPVESLPVTARQARSGLVRRGETRLVEAWSGVARQAWHGSTWQCKATRCLAMQARPGGECFRLAVLGRSGQGAAMQAWLGVGAAGFGLAWLGRARRVAAGMARRGSARHGTG